MQYSLNGLELTERFEGCRLVAYRDQGGVLTIGYGHTGSDVYPGRIITSDVAQALLKSDVHAAVACVNDSVEVPITQNEFDALVDFTFNVGTRNFKKSTLLKDLNLRNYAEAAAQFSLWVNAGGHRVPGLVERRKEEHDLFVR